MVFLLIHVENIIDHMELLYEEKLNELGWRVFRFREKE